MMDPLQEMRVQDFIDDKLQSTTDLDHLDDLLASVELQRTQLQAQLDDTTRELDKARSWGSDRQRSLAGQVEGFDRLQRSIDVRLRIVAASDAPDEAIRRLGRPMRLLRRVELAHSYLVLLQDVERLRAEARSHLPAEPRAALVPYSELRALSSRMVTLQAAADGAAPHLVAHVRAVTLALRDEMRDTMAGEFTALLAARGWPAKIDRPDEYVVDEEWRLGFEKLMDLQLPEILSSASAGGGADGGRLAVVPLLPMDVMADIFVKEFRFHFLGDRPTSDPRLVGRHCFPWLLRVVSTWGEFMRVNFAHVLADRFRGTAAEGLAAYTDPACALVTSLLPVMREKVLATAEEAVADPAFLSGFLMQLMSFDEDVRELGYDGDLGKEGWDGLASEVLDRHFDAWFQAEKDFALARFDKIMGAPDAWSIDYDHGGPGKAKPTFAAVRVTDLLRSVTSQYERVRRFSHKRRFLIDIQSNIMDEFWVRLGDSLLSYSSLISAVGRTLHGATKEQLATLEGTGALETLCKVYGSADHLVNVLEEWDDEEFFINFWPKSEATDGAAARGDRQKNNNGHAGSASGKTDSGGQEEAFFDKTIAGYAEQRSEALSRIIQSLVDSHDKAFRPYLSRAQWTTISEDPAFMEDPYQLAITAELDEPLRILKRDLDFLHRALATAAFRRVWREALRELHNLIWAQVLLRHKFTAYGAAQFAVDVHAMVALVGRYIPDQGGSHVARLQEGATLLNLPVVGQPGRGGEGDGGGGGADDAERKDAAGGGGGGGVVTLGRAMDRVMTDNTEAKKLLDELGLEGITPADARNILMRRVESSE